MEGKWKVIDIDRDPKGEILGATYVLIVPGGMLVKCVYETGSCMSFVPNDRFENITDWVKSNIINT